jgi:hypothetical protein
MPHISRPFAAAAALAALCLVVLAPAAHAQQGGERHETRREQGGGGNARAPVARGQYLDNRYQHNHYYPPRGYAVDALPRDRIFVNHYRSPYYFSGGVWYAPRGPRYVVVRPPIGLHVDILPFGFSTVWFGGFPYYYGNETYYMWRDRERDYEVVDPPPGAPAPAAPSDAAAPSDDVFIYPKHDQSPEQQAKDRYECHTWSVQQTGYDPSLPAGGVSSDQNAGKRADYFRALGACLTGRDYSVK